MKSLSLLVEGTLDEAVGRRIIEYAGGTVQTVRGKKGVSYIKKNRAPSLKRCVGAVTRFFLQQQSQEN